MDFIPKIILSWKPYSRASCFNMLINRCNLILCIKQKTRVNFLELGRGLWLYKLLQSVHLHSERSWTIRLSQCTSTHLENIKGGISPLTSNSRQQQLLFHNKVTNRCRLFRSSNTPISSCLIYTHMLAAATTRTSSNRVSCHRLSFSTMYTYSVGIALQVYTHTHTQLLRASF